MKAIGGWRQQFGGKTVVISGASAGIGRAAALAFAGAGARVALIGREPDALHRARDEIIRAGGQALALPLDVADANAVQDAARRVVSELGSLDIWVNSAMVTVFGTVAELRPEEVRRVTEVTYLGTVHGTMAALEVMRRQGRGRIVQVGSALAYRGIPLQAAYCGAKHAIQGFTESLRCELLHARSGVSVSIVHMPAVNTPQFEWARTYRDHKPRPVAPVYAPEAAARAILRAAKHGGREYWVGRSTAVAILGNALAPGLADRFLARTAFQGQDRAERVDDARRDNLQGPGPVDLHRTSGAFEDEAKQRAICLEGTKVRAGAAAGALTVAALLGICAGRWLGDRPAARSSAITRGRRGRLRSASLARY
jgi:NAD(P)-dependent dehydrogenase (short-subunit alcohol dehydrogenase family)